MPNPSSQQPRYIPRHAEARIKTVMADTRIVAIVGPRQAGKTTLARRIAAGDGRRFVSLDDESWLRFAKADPTGFVNRLQTAAIDEIQRAPNLVLALKRSVDEDQRPGRFLITGSVDLFKSMIVPDSLAGRVSVVELLPFSQAEIRGLKPPTLLTRAFAGDFPAFSQIGGLGQDLDRLILTGGYPQAVRTGSMRRKQEMLREYAGFLASRDLPEMMDVRKDAGLLSTLIEHAAAASGQLVNLSRMAASLQVDIKTVDRWLTLLERMFLVRRIRAWHRSQAKRLVKAPKLHFLDPGILAALREIDASGLERDRHRIAGLLESFVFSEIAKCLPCHDSSIRISHYRDKDGHEVDFVLETPAGRTVGMEVKAAASVYPGDFRGLHRLAAAAGARFAAGMVLYDGGQAFETGEKMFALPIRMLWE